MHKLAIVIPYYKIDHFEQTLISLAAQTDQRFALYIGNDYSPEDPLPLLLKYLPANAYSYFIYSENLGRKNLALQWARILEQVQEPWFQLLGDDDFISANFVETINRQLESLDEEINVIKVKSQLCDAQGKAFKRLYEGFKTGRYNVLDLMLMKFRGRLNSSLSEHVFRLSRYQEVGFARYVLAWHTDDMLVVQMADCADLQFVADALVSVRVYEGSTSGSQKNLLLKIAASKHFYIDFMQLLIRGAYPWDRKKAFLKSLHKYKNELGMPYLEAMYRRNGMIGRAHFLKYELRMLLKACMPTAVLRRVSKTEID